MSVAGSAPDAQGRKAGPSAGRVVSPAGKRVPPYSRKISSMDVFFPRRLSCGIVILNAQHELLLCHVTGQDHWDLPKGGVHTGESPLQTALRETCEETGMALAADELLDLGRLQYRLKKSLHLFAALMPRFDATRLRCETHFSQAATVRRRPEMDGYGWFGFECITDLCTRKMAAVLNGRLHLPSVLEALRARTAQVGLSGDTFPTFT